MNAAQKNAARPYADVAQDESFEPAARRMAEDLGIEFGDAHEAILSVCLEPHTVALADGPALRVGSVPLRLLPFTGPTARLAFHRARALRTRLHLAEDAVQDADGKLRWISTGGLVPTHVLERDAFVEPTQAHRVAYDDEIRAFMADYHQARQTMTEEQKAEEAFERRAAFGPGVVVVDVLTGEKTTT